MPERLALSEGLCVALLPQKQRMWTVSHHLFPVLSRLCTGATCASRAPLPWAARERGASGTSTFCETPITPAWPRVPQVSRTACGDCPGSTGHSPGKLQRTGLVRGEEESQIHSPGEKSPWKGLKNGIIQQFGISRYWSALLALNFPSLIN